jgi:hypothetical protein
MLAIYELYAMDLWPAMLNGYPLTYQRDAPAAIG